MKTQHILAKQQNQRAMDKYNSHYDNALYKRAIDGKSVAYANALIDDALAICGHPYYKISNRTWSNAALNFLTRFM